MKNLKIERKKFFGVYVYFSRSNRIRKQQELFRKDFIYDANLIKLNPEVTVDELKAALIIFFSLLDEQQRRLYAGLESLKIGHGGDDFIAQILGCKGVKSAVDFIKVSSLTGSSPFLHTT